MRIVLVQIYRFEPEIDFLRLISEEFSKKGLKVVFWTNIEHDNSDLATIPFAWNDTLDLIFDTKNRNNDYVDKSEQNRWYNFISFLETRYLTSESAYDVERNFRIANHIFDTLNPSLFLCWAGAQPCYAISKEIAISKNIPTLIWEAGMLPNTLLVDKNGICGQSELCNLTLPDIADDLRKDAVLFLENWRQQILLEVGEFKINQSQSPKILVLGGMDVANAVFYPSDKSNTTLVDYEDGIDIAIKVSDVNDGITIFRPHPREPKEQLERLTSKNVHIDFSTALYKSIIEADIIVGYGSKADFVALTLGKPFIMVGKGIISQKNCSYSALNYTDLANAVQNALLNKDCERHNDNYIRLIAWLISDWHYNRGVDGICKKGVKELVDEIINFADFTKNGGDFFDLFSEYGNNWYEKYIQDYQVRTKYISNEDPLTRLQNGINYFGAKSIIILDFDHTLWLGNSTEQFIENIKPRLWGELLDKVATQIWNKFNYRINFDLDHFRLLIITLFAPLSWYLWKRNIVKTIDKYWNEALWDVVQTNKYESLIIISYGFKSVIDPILKAKGLTIGKETNIIASNVLSKKNNVRKIGKVQSIDNKFENISWNETITVTDSLEDYPLLTKSKIGILTKWKEPAFIRTIGYYPFRYLNKCKYVNTTYFKRFIIEQDFIVWLLLLCSDFNHILPAILLFFSYQLVYEIGYYENDFIGSKKEENPTVSIYVEKYKDYNIKFYAWICSLMLTLIAINSLYDVFQWEKFIIWTGVLIISRIVFYIYNNKIPSERLIYYLILQSLKNFSGLILFIPNAIGLMLSIAHLFQHTMIYYIYRTGGDKNLFPRATIRAIAFFIGLIILAIIGIKLNLITLSIILVWLLQQELIEKRGDKYMIFNLVNSTKIFIIGFLSYFLSIIRKLRRLFLIHLEHK